MGVFSMILLPKKRILFIILVVFVSVFTYFFSTENLNKTIQTVSLPVTNKVVVLDAGHRSEKIEVRHLKMELQKQTQI